MICYCCLLAGIIAIVTIGSALLGSKLLEYTARQPEVGGRLLTSFLVIFAPIELFSLIGIGLSVFKIISL